MNKNILIASILLSMAGFSFGQIRVETGVKWNDTYSFDRCNVFKVDFYAPGDELMRTLNYRTWYNIGGNDGKSDGKEVAQTASGLTLPKNNYLIALDAPGKGADTQTIIDLANEVAIQVFGSDAAEPMYNAGKFRYPEGADIRKLDLVPAAETRTIAGHLCKKYTYAFRKITGSAWIATDVDLPNDYGIFRAAKMAALHNTLGVPGFVMEMTTEDARGGKTVMTTVSLGNAENLTVSLPKGKVGTAINTVNYFTF